LNEESAEQPKPSETTSRLSHGKKSRIWILLLIALAVIVAGVLVYLSYFKSSDEDTSTGAKSTTGVLSLDPVKEATHLSKVADANNAYFRRGFDVVWNVMEPSKGKYDWTENDQMVQGSKDKSEGEIYNLSIIWPYANWDQKSCHSGKEYIATGHLKQGGEDLYMGVPCDLGAYGEFIQKVVERYDGDGVNDMPGLKTPVKYWEVLNEPSMHGGGIGGAGEDLKFFVGTSEEYLSILKTSYEAIKKADPKAKVLHAGMAGMQQNFRDFWDPIFAGGAGNYFDIANIHSISTTKETEDLFVISFRKYLERFGITGKPIWVTEAQYGSLQDEPEDKGEFEELMARSTVFTLAQDAEKIFLIENWIFWGDKDSLNPDMDEKDKDKKEEKPKPDLSNNTTHKVYLNLLEKVNNFDSVEMLSEEFNQNPRDGAGATTDIGQYEFISGDKSVYVLWGENSTVASEISGKIKVTDIYGASKEMDSNNLVITNSPVFVEKL